MKTLGYAARSAAAPLAPFTFERRARRPTTSRSTSSSAASATPTSTTARNEWGGTIFPCVPGHEIVGRGHRGRRRGHALQGRRPRRRRLHGRLLPHLRQLPRRARAVLPEGCTVHLQQPRHAPGDADLRRLLEAASSCDEDFVAARSRTASTSAARGAAALRRHHHLLAAAPLEGRARARRSASSAWAGSATWA